MEKWWRGLAVMHWSQSTYLLYNNTPGPVNTWMGDLWAGKQFQYVASHLARLSLPSLLGI